MSKYANQAVIDRIEKKVQEIDPRLSFNSFVYDSETMIASSAGIYIKEKGNKKIIDALKGLGFKKRYRYKVQCGTIFDPQPGYYMTNLSIELPKE